MALSQTRRAQDARRERRLRKKRKLAFWNWTLDLRPVKTKADFVALIIAHFQERVRAGFIKEQFFELRSGACFWADLRSQLDKYFGNIHIRILGWAQFEKRQKECAKQFRFLFRQIRSEMPESYEITYDTEPESPLRPRTYIRYFYLGLKCKLTVPAVAELLRKHKWKTPVSLLEHRWPELEFEFEPKGARQLKNKPGLDLDFGEFQLHMVLNDVAGQVKQLRRYHEENYFEPVEGDPDEGEAVELTTCKAILEIWSWTPIPNEKTRLLCEAAIRCIREGFRDLYQWQDDPEIE